MKVLIIGGYSTPSIRSRMMIDFLLNNGHELVYETPEEVEKRRRRANGLHLFTVYDECRPMGITYAAMRNKPKHKSNGPRDRWGKVK